MATHSVSRIGALSLAKMLAVTYAFLGLFIGGIVSLFAAMGGAMGKDAAGGLGAMIFGVGAVIVLPIVYGCLGFVGGLITSVLYNLVAKVVGGIEIELD